MDQTKKVQKKNKNDVVKKRKCKKRKCSAWVSEVMDLKSKTKVSFKDALINASNRRKSVV